MQKYKFAIVSFFIAIVFWFSDAAIHYFIYKEAQFELIPDDFNELWMRMVIILLLILFGIYADYFTKKMLKTEKQLEASRIYKSMINATQHVLNNHLQQMMYFKMQAEKSSDFEKEAINEFDASIADTLELINKLSNIEKVTEKNIWESVAP